MDFKDGMKKRRNELKWSQQTLSSRSGVPQSTISAIESGVRKPTEETMVQIANGLRCTVGELLGENENTAAQAGDGIMREISILLRALPQEDCLQLRDYATWLVSRYEKQ